MTAPQPAGTPQPPRMVGPDADHTEVDGKCIDFGFAAHSCPAAQTVIALFARHASAPRMVNLHMHRDRIGLHVNYTPEGAREIARALLECADDVEVHNAAMATAQLATALGKPIMDPQHIDQDLDRRVRASRNPDAPEPAPHMEPEGDGPTIPIMLGIVAGLFLAVAGGLYLLGLAMKVWFR